jgi:hypothetical protein
MRVWRNMRWRTRTATALAVFVSIVYAAACFGEIA